MTAESPPRPEEEALEAGDLEGLDPGEAADHLFLHSALRRMLGHGAGVRPGQIERAMQGIHGQDAGAPQSWAFHRMLHSRSVAFVVTSAAAVLLIALILNMPAANTWAATPLAIVQRALESIDGSSDLEYRMSVEVADSPFADVIPREVILHIGGGERFTAQMPDMPFKMPDMWMGHDGQDYWMIPPFPGAPVFVCDEPPRPPQHVRRRRSEWMDPKQMFDFADLLTVSGLLRLLENDYDLELVDNKSDSDETLRVHGVLRTPNLRMPDEVDLEADAEDGMVRMLVMSWNKQARMLAPKKLILELVGRTTLPDGWYNHDSHHSPDAEVQRIEPK